MTINKEMLFRKKGFIQFLNSNQDDFNDFAVILQPKIETIIQKYQIIKKDTDDIKLAIQRSMDFIKKSYQKMDDNEWKRINDERNGELINLLENCTNREKFFIDDKISQNLDNRYLVLKKLALINWHLFMNVELDFESPIEYQKDFSRNNEKDKNLIIFVGKNAEGKSAIFNAIRMGFLGPEQYFQADGNLSQKDENILNILNKKAINEARSKNLEHILMEISVLFKIKKQEEKVWQDYCIKRTWKIKIDPKDDKKNSIYQFETEMLLLNNLGEGNHKPLDKETFETIFERYLPKPLQNLFIVNKTILTKPLMQQKSNFIQDTILSSSDFEMVKFLLSKIVNLKEFIESEEKTWFLKNVKENSEQLTNLDQTIKQKEKELEAITTKIVNFEIQIRSLNEEILKKKEQTKDFNQEDLNKYLELEEKLNNIKDIIEDETNSMNKRINNIYISYELNQIINWKEIKRRIPIIKKSLPELPIPTVFNKFPDFYKILHIILENEKCICNTPLSEESKEFFELQLKKDIIEVQHQIVEEINQYIQKPMLDSTMEKEEIQNSEKKILQLNKDLTYLNNQRNKLKPSSFQKEIKEKLKQLEKLNEDLANLKTKKNKSDEAKNKLIPELNKLKGEFEDLKQKQQDDSLKEKETHYKKLRFYIELSILSLKLLQEKYEIELQNYIQELITHYFKDIDWEGNFWQGFSIDENWKIHFLNKENQSILLPSDGQSKIITFSFICSLIELHRYKIPWIMDNILSEISDLNIEGFAKQVISNHEFPQQIFFLSNTEWLNIKNYIKSYVQSCFSFKKVSANESEVIKIENLEDLHIENEE